MKVGEFFGSEVPFFGVIFLIFLVGSGSYKFWALRFIFFRRSLRNTINILYRTFGVLYSRAQGPFLFIK